jgi:outer membrane receptor protein involved in Fe transport
VGGKISALPGIDPRNAFFINSNLPQDVTVDVNGNRRVSNPGDGLQVNVTSLGVEAQFKLAGDLTVTNRFRKSSIDGRFIGLFPAGSAPTAAANGADRYTGSASVFSAHMFNTSLDDMGNTFNDLRLQKAIKLGDGQSLTVTGGIFSGVQSVAQTWYWNRYNIELKGDGARVLNNAGAATTSPVGDATTTWGGCCFRSFDVSLTALAPYASVTYDWDALSVEASVRQDKQRASGWQTFGGATAGVQAWDNSRRNKVSYETDATSYSVGANWRFSKDLAVFGRVSSGSSWASPDRVIWNTDVATGKTPYPVNETEQIEAGVKFRMPGLSAFVTVFNAKTKEDGGFEVTSRKYLKDAYTATGVEAEVSYSLGSLALSGGATVTNAKVDATGKKPRRQANLVFQLTPSYQVGPFELGATVISTGKSYADNENTVTLPGYTVVNAFAAYEVTTGLTLQLGLNNALNSIGYTEAEGQGNLTSNPLYVARSINGRSAKATLRYTF